MSERKKSSAQCRRSGRRRKTDKTVAWNTLARSADSRSISIWPNRRGPSESLVLVVVLVLVIGDGAVENEDEKEDEDDLFAAPARYAVSPIFNRQSVQHRTPREDWFDAASGEIIRYNATNLTKSDFKTARTCATKPGLLRIKAVRPFSR